MTICLRAALPLLPPLRLLTRLKKGQKHSDPLEGESRKLEKTKASARLKCKKGSELITPNIFPPDKIRKNYPERKVYYIHTAKLKISTLTIYAKFANLKQIYYEGEWNQMAQIHRIFMKN